MFAQFVESAKRWTFDKGVRSDKNCEMKENSTNSLPGCAKPTATRDLHLLH